MQSLLRVFKSCVSVCCTCCTRLCIAISRKLRTIYSTFQFYIGEFSRSVVLFSFVTIIGKDKKIKTKTLGVWFYSCQQVHFNRNNLKFCNSHGLRFIWELRMNMFNGKTPETNFTLIIHAFFDFDNKLLTTRSIHSSLSWAKTFALNPIQVHLIMQFISILFYFQQRRHLPSLLPVPNGVI